MRPLHWLLVLGASFTLSNKNDSMIALQLQTLEINIYALKMKEE